MAKPTAEQIAAEAKKLREMKLKIPRRNAFGDDNWEVVGAQIEVLESNLSYDLMANRWGDTAAEEDYSEHVYDSASDARRWMDGEEKDSPTSAWAPLVK